MGKQGGHNMAIGAKDHIDKLLVEKYASRQVNNIENDVSKLAIPPERYWEIMNDYAQVQRAVLTVKGTLTNKNHARKLVPAVQIA